MDVKINEAEFKDWLATEEREYASLSIESPNRHASPGSLVRLSFVVLLSGGFVVRCGSKELYRGDDFALAAKTFNDLS